MQIITNSRLTKFTATPPGRRGNGRKNSASRSQKAGTQNARRTPNPSPRKPEPGKGISAKKAKQYLRFVAFLAVIGMAYIWNTHYAEARMETYDELKVEVKTLKDNYFQQQADFHAALRYTQLIEATDSLGLQRLRRPPFVLKSE